MPVHRKDVCILPNEEFTKNNNALSENELEDVSGGWQIIDSVATGVGSAVIKCPECGSPTTVTVPEGGYHCLQCGANFMPN